MQVGVGLDVDVVADKGNSGNLLRCGAGDVDGSRAYRIGRRRICSVLCTFGCGVRN